MLVGGGMIVLFEALAYANKNYYGSVNSGAGSGPPACRCGPSPSSSATSEPDPTLFRLIDQFSLP